MSPDQGVARRRCGWAGSESRMVAYHDAEWGVPERDSRAMWELLMLEGFQAGLSWSTVLRKREAFRAAFAGFDPEKVARFGERDIERLMLDASIIRARAKIEGTVRGAQVYLEMRDSGEHFSAWAWEMAGGKAIQGAGDFPVSTELSETISRELKRRGFKFCGPVIAYAWMQATGLVNDHAPECFRRAACARLKRAARSSSVKQRS